MFDSSFLAVAIIIAVIGLMPVGVLLLTRSGKSKKRSNPLKAVVRNIPGTVLHDADRLEQMSLRRFGNGWEARVSFSRGRYTEEGTPLESARVTCEDCRTPHHRECWEYFGSCATFACPSLKFKE